MWMLISGMFVLNGCIVRHSDLCGTDHYSISLVEEFYAKKGEKMFRGKKETTENGQPSPTPSQILSPNDK